MTELASLDGRIAPASETGIPVIDGGFVHADGVFEILRIIGGRPFALREHLERLDRSARKLHLGYPVDCDLIAREAKRLLEERGGPRFDGCLRIVLTSGNRRLLITEPVPAWPERVRLACITYSPTWVLDGVKSLSYGANMLAGRLARESGADEALLVTPHGRVLEAPTSSFFYALDDGVLCTPPLDEHILASITRDVVMQAVDVHERSLTKDQLSGVSEAFLASTTRDVQPVAAIDNRDLGETGPRTTEAGAAFRSEVLSRLH